MSKNANKSTNPTKEIKKTIKNLEDLMKKADGGSDSYIFSHNIIRLLKKILSQLTDVAHQPTVTKEELNNLTPKKSSTQKPDDSTLLAAAMNAYGFLKQFSAHQTAGLHPSLSSNPKRNEPKNGTAAGGIANPSEISYHTPSKTGRNMPIPEHSETAINDILFSHEKLEEKIANLLRIDSNGHNALSWSGEKNKNDLLLIILEELRNDPHSLTQAMGHVTRNRYSPLQSKILTDQITEKEMRNLIDSAHDHNNPLLLLTKIQEALKLKKFPEKFTIQVDRSIDFEREISSMKREINLEEKFNFILKAISYQPRNLSMIEKLFQQKSTSDTMKNAILTDPSNHENIISIFRDITLSLTAETKTRFLTSGGNEDENILCVSSLIQSPEIIKAILSCLNSIEDRELLLICLKSRSGPDAYSALHVMSSSNNPCIDELIKLILTLDIENQVEQLSQTDSQEKLLIERENIHTHIPSLFPYIAYCAEKENEKLLLALKKVIDKRPVNNNLIRCYELAQAIIALSNQDIENKEKFIQPALKLLIEFAEGSTESTIPNQILSSLATTDNLSENTYLLNLVEKLQPFRTLSGEETNRILAKSGDSFLALLCERATSCLKLLASFPHQRIGLYLTQMTKNEIPVISEPDFRPYLTRRHIMCAMHHASHTTNWQLLKKLKTLCHVNSEETETLSRYYRIASIYLKIKTITSPVEDYTLRQEFYEPILNAIYDDETRENLISQFLNYLKDLKIDIPQPSELQQALIITRFLLLKQKTMGDVKEIIHLACCMENDDPVTTFKILKQSIESYFQNNPHSFIEQVDISLFFEISQVASLLKRYPQMDPKTREDILGFTARFLSTVYRELPARRKVVTETPQSVLSMLPKSCQDKIARLTGPKL